MMRGGEGGMEDGARDHTTRRKRNEKKGMGGKN
jgi:hypothetical protein